MTWQDALIAGGQLVFAAALVPSLLSARKPHAVTSAVTGSTLLAFAVAYASLSLTYSTAAATLCGVMWIILMAQELSARRAASRKTRADGSVKT